MTARSLAPAGMHTVSVELPVEGDLPSFDGATGWLNSPRLTPADLHGKVVLVNFWTYTCINWLRQLPYVRAWADKYADHGLVVVGVHTPEFGFERNLDNVTRAVRDMRIGYPVAVDSDYAVWGAFDNHFWPALYAADVGGLLRYHQFGEGEYQRTEMVIQQLLSDAGFSGVPTDMVTVGSEGFEGVEGFEVAADWDTLRSPETYLGYERTGGFDSPEGTALGTPREYSAPAYLRLNHWALSGQWAVGGAAVTLHAATGRIAHRFQARDLHLVMGPAIPGESMRFRVLLDGQAPGAAHGLDIDDQGNGVVSEQRLYQLIRQPAAVTEHTFEIAFVDPGVQAFAFTFG